MAVKFTAETAQILSNNAKNSMIVIYSLLPGSEIYKP